MVEQVTRERTRRAVLLQDQGRVKEARELLMQNANEIQGLTASMAPSQRMLDLQRQYYSLGRQAPRRRPRASSASSARCCASSMPGRRARACATEARAARARDGRLQARSCAHMPLGPRAMAAMPVRDTSISPSSVMMEMNCSILRGAARNLEHEVLGGGVDDVGAEDLGHAQRLDALVALAGDLDQRQLALQRLAEHGEIDDAVHVDQPLQLGLDLGQHHRRGRS